MTSNIISNYNIEIEEYFVTDLKVNSDIHFHLGMLLMSKKVKLLD